MPNIATMCWVSSRLMLNIVTMLLVSRWCNGELLCVVVLNGGYDRLNKLEEDKHVWVNLQLPTILLNHCHNLLHHLGRERRERERVHSVGCIFNQSHVHGLSSICCFYQFQHWLTSACLHGWTESLGGGGRWGCCSRVTVLFKWSYIQWKFDTKYHISANSTFEHYMLTWLTSSYISSSVRGRWFSS